MLRHLGVTFETHVFFPRPLPINAYLVGNKNKNECLFLWATKFREAFQNYKDYLVSTKNL